MSKKSERSARLRTQRMAEANAPAKPDSPAVSDETRPEAPRAEPRKPLPKWLFRTLLGVAVLAALACISGVLSAIFPPSVPTPSPLMASIVPPIDIVNQSFLPIYRVRYECQFVSIQDQSGFALPAKAPVPDAEKTQSILYHSGKIPVECVGGTNLSGIRIKSVEFRVSISYFHAGWPFRRHTEYRVRSEIDAQRNFLRWVVD